ncbi:MAG: HWE histidine kinase domain-containing protein [Hyphomicrobium sp.]|jgi:two-component sensor histidine kinase
MSGYGFPANILVVDGSPNRHVAFRSILEGLGQQIVEVASGEDALRLLAEAEFAVVLLDVHMPGMSGHETAKRMRQIKRARHTPIIFLAALADEVQANEGYELGAVDYIFPAIVPATLRAKVKVFVDLFQIRAELAQSHALLEQRVRERTEELAQSTESLRIEVRERKRGEERLRILVSELTHRVKNLLAVLQSIIMRTLTETRSVVECREILIGRLHALAHAHELLTEAYWKGATMREIVEAEISGFSDRVVAAGPDVVLTGSAVQTFSLIVHELATNAAKYGALSNTGGAVRIDWDVTPDEPTRYLNFSWKELGGPSVAAPSSTGFGLTLISTMAGAYALQPIVEFPSEGLACRLRLPLDVVAAKTDAEFMLSGGAPAVT